MRDIRYKIQDIPGVVDYDENTNNSLCIPPIEEKVNQWYTENELLLVFLTRGEQL
jgi:hypothetical protein